MSDLKYSEVMEMCNNIQDLSDEETKYAYFEKISYILYNNGNHDAYDLFQITAFKSFKDINIKFRIISKYFFLKKNNYLTPNYYVYDFRKILTILNDLNDEEVNYILTNLLENYSYYKIYDGNFNIPDNLKFGVELEYDKASLDLIKTLFETNTIEKFFNVRGVPNDVTSSIVNNSTFNIDHDFNKWHFSKEGRDECPEASSPILTNNISSYRQISAICLLFEILGAETSSSTGLHINIGADYFSNNIDAINKLLIIWSECEDLFYKISNEIGEYPRGWVLNFAYPIKNKIQNYLNSNINIDLENEYEFNKFLYYIQGKGKLTDLFKNFYEALESNTMEKTFDLKKAYDTTIRYTSINFNHMTLWNEDKGRIEFRIFNSSLNPYVIIENILLVAKLCEVSLKLATDSNYKINEYQELLRHDINEEKKLKALLNLLFDNEIDKHTFYIRWKCVHDDESFDLFKVGTNTYVNKSKKRSKH